MLLTRTTTAETAQFCRAKPKAVLDPAGVKHVSLLEDVTAALHKPHPPGLQEASRFQSGAGKILALIRVVLM